MKQTRSMAQKADQKNTVLFIFGWLEIPME